MPEVFKCPACSAPLEYQGKMMQKCSFCGSNVIVPSETIRHSSSFGGAGVIDFTDISALTGKALKLAEIQQNIQSGNKINAIKIFRETFGVGLKEAKDAVEAMERGESIDISGMQVRSTGPGVVNASVQRGVQVNAAPLVKSLIVIGGLIFAVIGVVIFFVARNQERGADPMWQGQATPAKPVNPISLPKPDELTVFPELLKFGGEGTGAGKFKDNRTVAVDPAGNIYSADYSAGRIQMFDPEGTFKLLITGDTTKTVDALAADRRSNLFALQGYDVHRFSTDTGEEKAKYRVDNASDLTVGLDGRVYITSRYGDIYVYGADDKQIRKFKISKDLGIGDVELLAVDGTGNYFIVDGRSSAIYKLGADGKLISRFGGRSEPGDRSVKSMFDSTPRDIQVDPQGRVFASLVSRIAVFDPAGNFIGDFKATQAFGLAFNDAGELFVASRPNVVKYKPQL